MVLRRWLFSPSYSPHLRLVPGFHFAAVLVDNALVLISDLIDDGRQVLLRCSIHLHIDGAGGHEGTQGSKLLEKGTGVKGQHQVMAIEGEDHPDEVLIIWKYFQM